MASPETIDIAALLLPISEDQPAGVDLRADTSASSPFFEIKSARRAAREKERIGSRRTIENSDGEEEEILEIPDTRAEWRPVYEQAQKLLAESSKDLEVMAWFIEAAVRLEGFAGLRDAFKLARETIDQYWDTCYPVIDDYGVEERVSQLAGLNGIEGEGTLLVPIRNVLITEGNNAGPYAFWHYQQAVALQQIVDPEARQRKISAGSITLEMIDQACIETDAAYFRNLSDDLVACIDEFGQLTERLDALCADESPPSSNIKREITAVLDALQKIAKSALEDAAVVDATSDVGNENGEAIAAVAGGGAPASAAGLNNREDAFRLLLQVADFFRRTEPHSPLPYALEQAVRWGRMPLPALLSELVGDQTTRDDIFRLTGIQETGDASSDDDGY